VCRADAWGVSTKRECNIGHILGTYEIDACHQPISFKMVLYVVISHVTWLGNSPCAAVSKNINSYTYEPQEKDEKRANTWFKILYM
jgi:hypothetical protein